jgi:hypothetical protein
MSLQTPELDYLVRTFHHGYQDSPQPDTLPPGATPDAKNCLFAGLQLSQHAYPVGSVPPRATLQKRTGARLLTSAALAAGHGFDGLYEFRKVGQTSGTLIGVTNGAAYYWTGVAWVQIGATAPFTVGARVFFFTYRNLVFITDGAVTRVWDGVLGTDLFTSGQVAPTGAGALTVTAGPGVTGTYEGFQVWYDSTHDHETSPGPLTAQVVFANQTRTWAKPAGAPAANYDKWRVYCRRVDTNEVYFKRVAEVAIAAVTTSEVTTDAARNLATLGPLPNQNDQPPGGLFLQMEFQGYRLACLANDDQLYVSKLGDPQSQSGRDILGVARGKGGELRSLNTFGTEAVIQKASKTYRLRGDRMPFIPEERHSTFGNVGAKSSVEVAGKFYAWDEEKGPYWTDLQANWVPIGTARVQRAITNVPKTSARDIECVYLKSVSSGLVIWSIPQGSSTRRRTLLAYVETLDTWLPPITGLEYAALATQIDANGSVNLYAGDYWGRLFQYFTDNVEGVPSGSLVARVSSSTSGTVTCDNELTVNSDATATVGGAVAFYTTGAGLMGLPVLHIDANGNTQWRRIQSNTAAVLTLDTTNDSAWNTLPVAGDRIVVGGIDWYWTSPVIDHGDPFRKKIGRYFAFQATPGSSSFTLGWQILLEGLTTRAYLKTFGMTGSASWGSGLWGAMQWGGGDPDRQKRRVARTFFGMAFRIQNPYPNQPVEVLSLRLAADWLHGKLVKSGATH